MPLEAAKYIPWLSAAAAVLCGVCCCRKSWRVLAAPICIAALLGGFALTVGALRAAGPHDLPRVITAFDWIHAGNTAASPGANPGAGVALQANMGYFLDPLTLVMLCVVTGIGSLVAIYAAGYMAGDRGYARFFAGVSLFIFAMTSLVMADNLILLYLGWEGVGLCSYLLIGYYYDKPSAVAAAKKAFIVNRIGDLGFALGIFLIYYKFGTVEYTKLFAQLAAQQPGPDWVVQIIPFLLMLGAFGKSAQLPLYVWLPDAMEGPTPVSALIHAATMVTAGVYMIARLFPLFTWSPFALPTVAVVGGVTALFAATIALCQYDIKRIYAYSTISQL
jgi:NADH-quinone oxidoreductase subunit L